MRVFRKKPKKTSMDMLKEEVYSKNRCFEFSLKKKFRNSGSELFFKSFTGKTVYTPILNIQLQSIKLGCNELHRLVGTLWPKP